MSKESTWTTVIPSPRSTESSGFAGIRIASRHRATRRRILDAARINGDVIRVDGGERVSGLERVRADGGPRHAVRRLAMGALAPWLGVRARDLSFVRDGRLPHLRFRGAPVPVEVSLSHRGRFVAFACLLHGASASAA